MVACGRSEKLKMNVNQSTAGVSDYFELLKPRVIKIIETEFELDMKELGYL